MKTYHVKISSYCNEQDAMIKLGNFTEKLLSQFVKSFLELTKLFRNMSYTEAIHIIYIDIASVEFMKLPYEKFN